MRAGASEFELAAEMEHTLRATGGEFTGLPVICSRDDHAAGRGMPSEDRVRPGDLLHVELAGCVRRYHAVLMRSIALTDFSPGMRAAVDVLEESAQAAIEAVRPGIPIGDLERARRRVTDRAGYAGAWFARLGYGVGISYPPNWLMGLGVQEDNQTLLEPGMTFTLQPVLNVVEHGYSYLIGDTVLVTDQACERLTNSSWEPRAPG
jgi:Xaa-Pro aminopeptidase